MKWFRHNSDSYSNLKLMDILLEFGTEGYAIYWLCLELIAQQGVDYRLNGRKSWLNALQAISKTSEENIKKILKRFGELKLICSKSLKKGELYIPKMEEYADDYTRRTPVKLRTNFRQTTDKLPSTIQYNTNNTIHNKHIVHFHALWLKYPNRTGKKEAYRHYLASVKTEKDVQNIEIALHNYNVSKNVKNGYILNGKTWFNNWEDWIVPPVTEKSDAEKYRKPRAVNEQIARLTRNVGQES